MNDWTDYLDYDDALEVLGTDEQKQEEARRQASLPKCRLCPNKLEIATERFFDTCTECMQKQQEKIKHDTN